MLLDDVQMAFTRLAAGEPVALPPVSASFKSWALDLLRLAATDDVRESARFWAGVDAAPDPVEAIVTDASRAANREADAQSLDVWLDAESTRELLHRVPGAYHTETPEVVLTALAQALADWTGVTRMRLAIEGHGRDVPGVELDLSRSLGWFTAAYPVVVDLTNTPAAGDALKAVKEQLRVVPHKGVSYGLLALAAGAESGTEPRAGGACSGISFNYLGQLDAALSGGSSYGGAAGFAAATEPTGPARDPEAQRPHLLDVVVSIEGGRLRATWVYPSRLLTRDDVQRAADAMVARLRGIIAHCLDPDAGGYTESDFPEMDFAQDELAALLDALDNRTGPA
jgi:non-ribosomal peptide synthase protein (TIGR01720 family)